MVTALLESYAEWAGLSLGATEYGLDRGSLTISSSARRGILKQNADNKLIRPRAEYIGPRNVPYVPIDER